MNRGWNIIYCRRNYCKIKITEDKIEQKKNYTEDGDNNY